MIPKKRSILLCLVLAAALLTGCAQEKTAVYVQSVEVLIGWGGIAPGDRFSGIVEAESVTSIEKDGDKTIAELLVKEGDQVRENQPLFSYDTEELQLSLDKQRLELEQLKTSIENLNDKIATLEKSLNSVSGSTKLQYTLEIQTSQVDIKEAELKIKTKETEIRKSEELLNHATVVSPIDGRIQSINENGGTDRNGDPLPYITIQKSGAYRIKGVLGELQMGGILEGDRLTILDRTGSGRTWSGTVSLVDYTNPYQGSQNNNYYSSSDEMTSSSRYPFYVIPDSLEGLLLGQHVYMEREQAGDEAQGLPISIAFVCRDEDGSPYVWAEENGRLAKRPVVLGQEQPESGTVSVLEGLSTQDYIAFPSELCQTGAPTTRDLPAPEEAAEDDYSQDLPEGEDLGEPLEEAPQGEPADQDELPGEAPAEGEVA